MRGKGREGEWVSDETNEEWGDTGSLTSLSQPVCVWACMYYKHTYIVYSSDSFIEKINGIILYGNFYFNI